jgi:tRNA (Thr-GGU) A37 N-methylase
MKDIPWQGYRSNKTGEVLVYKEYAEGLEGINGFSHIQNASHFESSE